MRVLLLVCCAALFASCSAKVDNEIRFQDNVDAAYEASLKEEKPLVVIFSAKWCEPCQAMKANVYPNIPNPNRFVWCYVDIDEYPLFAEQLSVDSVPCIHILKNKRLVAELMGLQTVESLSQVLDKCNNL